MDNFTKDIILLNMLQDIGYIRLKGLLEEFKTPEAIFNTPLDRLQKVKGVGRNIAESVKSARWCYDIAKELSLIKKYGIKITTIFDGDYPANLKNIYDPPILLYIKGSLEEADNLAVAMVGSRRCTHYGIRTAERLAGELAACGITIVSGLARGIDTAAHKGAIAAGGRAIAVLGNGLASVYPSENKKLADEIVKNGALVSEFPMEMPPHKRNFPQRNRVISGFSKGVVVVEAAKRSGALITANFALDESREVFAVPGAAGQVTSQGTNNLIREGAKLVEDARDILEELEISLREIEIKREKPRLANSYQKSIYNLLSDQPRDIDSITEALSLGAKQAKTALLNLEIEGVIKQLPGKLYVRAQ